MAESAETPSFLVLVYFPTQSFSVPAIKHHLKKTKAEFGFLEMLPCSP